MGAAIVTTEVGQAVAAERCVHGGSESVEIPSRQTSSRETVAG